MLWKSVNNYFKEKFGEKVHRVAVDAGFTCPNRDGSKGTGGCIYCSEEGARAAYVNPEMPVAEQIRTGIKHISARFKVNKFIAYFQAYSNTYAPVEKLEKLYNEALNADERIVGLAIGTRADCVSSETLDLLQELSKKTFLWIEFGLQSIRQDILDKINRCDTVENFRKIAEETARRNIKTLAHIIFGLPGEQREDAKKTALFLNELNIWGVKLHALYITKQSIMGNQHLIEPYDLISMEEYITRAADFLENIRPEMLIHRLTSDIFSEKLLAPVWIKEKNLILKRIEQELISRNSTQGDKFYPAKKEKY